MRVVFLDFDGVLNDGFGGGLPLLVDRLNRVTQQTGAVIVVHSSWRWGRSVEKLREILRSWGVTGSVCDKCPVPIDYKRTADGLWVGNEDWASFQRGIVSTDERCIAIQRWLDEHPEVIKYVIFDDDHHLGHFVGTPEFIQTQVREGLTDDHVIRAIRHLNNEDRL